MAVDLLVADAVAVEDAHGPRRAHHPRHPADVDGRDARERRGPLGREGAHMGRQLVEAVAPLVHEGAVVEPLPYDDVQKRQGERAVGARAHRQPHVSLRRERVEERSDVDHRGARRQRVEPRRHRPLVDRRVLRVGAPHHQKPRLVQLRRRAHGSADGHRLARAALERADAAVQVVGAAEHVEEAPPDGTQHRVGLGREHAVARRPVRIAQSRELRGDGAERLVPRTAHKLN